MTVVDALRLLFAVRSGDRVQMFDMFELKVNKMCNCAVEQQSNGSRFKPGRVSKSS